MRLMRVFKIIKSKSLCYACDSDMCNLVDSSSLEKHACTFFRVENYADGGAGFSESLILF
jgi:hypothetical protein